MSKDQETAKKLYNKQFQDYSKEQENYPVIQDLRKRMYDFLGDISGQNILFAGCGAGYECVEAVKNGAKVSGVDISEEAIKLAKENSPKGDFHVSDIQEMDFKDGTFDKVISVLSLMYLENLESALNEFKRILKDKGRIIIVVPHPVRKMVKYNDMNYFVKGKHWEEWRGVKRFNYYRLFEDYLDAFSNVGLKLVNLKEPKPPEAEEVPEKELKHPHFLIFKLEKDKPST